ncbi:MAG TPA: hypothetical protein VE964_12580 [Myxococcales bacterium]|nr:hypothetical protein [Myxococcales bacterium]
MALKLTVKPMKLWMYHGGDRKGLLADTLEPLAAAGVHLQIAMAYRLPKEMDRCAIEVFPIDGPTAEAEARRVGFAVSDTPCLLVEGDDRRGLGAAISKAISDAKVSMDFVMAQVVGKKFSAAIGFANGEDAAAATKAIQALARAKE